MRVQSLSVRCVALIVSFATTVSGCSYALTAGQEQSPAVPVTTIVIGAVGTDDEDRQREARLFRRALVAALRETDAFATVLSVPPRQMPRDAALVTGRFQTISDGSEGLRFVVGYGAGAPRLRARFTISDAAGQPLAAFSESHRSYAGAGWKGHFSPADLDELTTNLAGRTANVIVRWSRGEPMEREVWEDLVF